MQPFTQQNSEGPIAAAPKRVLIIRTDRIGETLLTLPLAAVIHAGWPNAKIIMLVQEPLQSLLERFEGISEVIAHEPSPGIWWWSSLVLSRRLKRHCFDIVFIANPKKELHLAARLSGIPIRVGYKRKWSFCLTHRLPDRKSLGERHEVEYNLDLAAALGLPTAPIRWQLTPGDVSPSEDLSFLKDESHNSAKSFIAIHPWSSNPRKQWPAERFVQLIQILVETASLPVVLIGGTQEKQAAERFTANQPHLINLVGRLSLNQLATLLAHSRVVVSNDSGPAHLAAAVGTPAVVLFGTKDPAAAPRRWRPWGEHHTVIWRPSMEAIELKDVLEAVRSYLGPAAISR